MIKLMIFGTGENANKVTCLLNRSDFEVVAYLDNDCDKQNTLYKNKYKIISPTDINEYQYDKIVICSSAYDEIRNQLIQEQGIEEATIEDQFYINKYYLQKYYNNPTVVINEEISELLERLENEKLQVFPYPFCEKYKNYQTTVYKDFDCGLFFVLHQAKRMYFSRGFKTESDVLRYYGMLLMEQDNDSPHRYMEGDYCVNYGDIVVDVGAAEGNFALEVIELAEKVYIIESDPDWIEALQHTFLPFREKVEIINKYLTSETKGGLAKLDDLLLDKKLDFIKLDIEGEEIKALIGSEQILKQNSNLKIATCSYHHAKDEEMIKEILEEYNYVVTASKGYMVFITNENCADENQPKKFVKGVLRAKKIFT